MNVGDASTATFSAKVHPASALAHDRASGECARREPQRLSGQEGWGWCARTQTGRAVDVIRCEGDEKNRSVGEDSLAAGDVAGGEKSLSFPRHSSEPRCWTIPLCHALGLVPSSLLTEVSFLAQPF